MMLPKGLLSRPYSPLKLAGSVAICLFILNFWFGRSVKDILDPTSPVDYQAPSPTAEAPTHQPPCREIKGADDVLVIVKTGSTELQDKLPVHLRTTLSCYPDTVIFSDFEEDLEGHHIFDALEPVDELVKSTHDDFALYRRLKAEGRKALEPSELSGILADSGGISGKTDNPGWRLDKWKFLPMMNRTLDLYPQKKWYVFVETDTYLVWSNLLEWISLLDAGKPVYAGYQMQIGDQIFAHGGAGFLVSNPAMHRVVDHIAKSTSWWEKFTDSHWAGDCVLGKAFQEAGVQLLWSWPLIQGDKPGTLNPFKNDYGYRMWCFPVVTYHHLSVDEIETMWKFEQDWIHNVRTFKPSLYRLYLSHCSTAHRYDKVTYTKLSSFHDWRASGTTGTTSLA